LHCRGSCVCSQLRGGTAWRRTVKHWQSGLQAPPPGPRLPGTPLCLLRYRSALAGQHPQPGHAALS
jgi:hypothetical protein